MASSTATATKGKGGKGGEEGEESAKGGKKKLIVIVLVAVLALGGAAYWFLLKPSSASATEKKKAVVYTAGTVVTADPISVNLADGHYLKIGIALQEPSGVKESVDTSEALDTLITLYSGKTMAELSDPTQRAAIKAELVKEVTKDYTVDGTVEVYDVYFTQYVMQ